ncbi:polysaccharide deacetylase family protein 10 [Achromobacter xylosoxidans A8]|uniref:Polysaccharide deacetylase family protein 10 n=1 Tax=Achromobacter xylosoxidans (strain A8) TaxID=762376 RepID=E3HPZ1_ACHXA|nr:polysaccharide deacetylase family protein [Achromobacter xylosoxidans]ADP17149.1 polysaccharide deacetylase family protein 10 [Achromobacter xylosoxidans A8]
MAFRYSLPRIFTVCFSLWASWCSAQTVALTFDDGLNPDKQPKAAEWNAQLLGALQKHGIQSALFPALSSIGGANGLGLVEEWSRAGHWIGNHTASHPSLDDPKLSLEAFIADVETADAALKRLPGFVPMLRFPYLREGDTQAKRDGMRDWMTRNGYRNGLVSIDASDWYYSRVYADHLKAGDAAKAQDVKQRYVRHLLDRAAYYDGLARQLLGRSPKHVMLLHTNPLNAEALPDVIAALTEQGWTITSASAAFEDPLYAQAPATLPAGESIVWALAKARNLPDLRYPAEGSEYEEPLLRDAGLLP